MNQSFSCIKQKNAGWCGLKISSTKRRRERNGWKKGLTKSLNCFITLINIIKHVLRYDSLAAGCCQFKFFSSKHRKLYVCIMHFPVTRWDICVWKNSSCRVCLRKLMFAPLWDCWVMKSFRICLKITSASLIWFDQDLMMSWGIRRDTIYLVKEWKVSISDLNWWLFCYTYRFHRLQLRSLDENRRYMIRATVSARRSPFNYEANDTQRLNDHLKYSIWFQQPEILCPQARNRRKQSKET